MTETYVAVIGGGAAGLMAAGTAARRGLSVLVVEKNDRCGLKVRITGKGRCNVTNNCEINDILKNIPTNPRFLYSALSGFSPEDTMAFFESRGVSLKTERGNRVFPQSDKAADIANTLESYAKESGAKIIKDRVKGLWIEDNILMGIETEKHGRIRAQKVIVATGGLSYPKTGSNGDGYMFARQAGHTVTKLSPSLVPVTAKENWCKDLMGLSLKNVTLSVLRGNKEIFSELGEMLFTHFGVSGPLVLSASAIMKNYDINNLKMKIDLKPALDQKQLDARVLRDFSKYINRDFINSLSDLLPAKLIPVIAKLSGIPFNLKVNAITKEQRSRLVQLLKELEITPTGYRPIEEAIVTSGGVCVKEINPKTMESKLLNGLYFAGEVIDVDGFTGGFNLQIAFSTGFAAGSSV